MEPKRGHSWQPGLVRPNFSCFWIDVGGGVELFRYTGEMQEHWTAEYPHMRGKPPYDDYYVVEFYTQLVSMYHHVLNPVPLELAARVADGDAWQAWIDAVYAWEEASGELSEEREIALRWWNQRTWDAFYLRYPPQIWLWSPVDGMVRIRWDNRSLAEADIPVWTAQAGETTLSAQNFVAETREFCIRFLDAMAERIEQLAREPNLVGAAKINLVELRKQQEERVEWQRKAFEHGTHDDDWMQTLSAMHYLDEKLRA